MVASQGSDRSATSVFQVSALVLGKAYHVTKPKVKGWENTLHLHEVMAGVWRYTALRDVQVLMPII